MITINNDPFQEYQKDFAYCESIIKKNSKSFYLAFSQLPKRKAQSVYAVYAFCRRADDLIDRDNNQAGLRQLERQLLDFNEGKVPNDPVWRALSVVFDNFPMVTAPFFDMLTGQRKDADFKQPETRKDLEEYCYYVAGSVGLMLLPLLTERPADIVVPAKKLGEAMQLTNILRDVGEDYRDRQRIYLPQTLLDAYNVDEAMIKRLSYHDEEEIPQNFIDLWEHIYQIGDQYYDSIKPVIKDFSQVAQLPILSSAYIYHGIGNAVRKANHNCFTKRNYTNNIERMRLIYQARKVLKDI